MKQKKNQVHIIFLFVLLFIFVFSFGCVSNDAVASETPLKPKTLDPGTITVGVVVDTDSYSVTNEEIITLISTADSILQNNTKLKFSLLGIQRVDYSALQEKAKKDRTNPIVLLYPDLSKQPEYVVILLSDSTSASFGGYSYSVKRSGFCNRCSKPDSNSQEYVAVGVIDWTHMYSSCGYNRSDSKNLVHVSDVSFGGECRNQNGVKCIYNEKFGYYQCNDSETLNSLYNSNKYYFAASTIVHELMHFFGEGVLSDHFGTQGCNKWMNGTDYGAYSLNIFQSYAGTCPYLYEVIEKSYKECG